MKHRVHQSSTKYFLSIVTKDRQAGKEYLIFFELLVCQDYWGNKIDHTRQLGKVEVPVIQVRKALNPDMIRSSDLNAAKPEPLPPEIDSMETVYLWVWSSMKEQLRKWRDSGVIADDCKFYLWVGQSRMGLKNISFDHFLDLSVEDLELLANNSLKYAGSKVENPLA